MMLGDLLYPFLWTDAPSSFAICTLYFLPKPEIPNFGMVCMVEGSMYPVLLWLHVFVPVSITHHLHLNSYTHPVRLCRRHFLQSSLSLQRGISMLSQSFPTFYLFHHLLTFPSALRAERSLMTRARAHSSFYSQHRAAAQACWRHLCIFWNLNPIVSLIKLLVNVQIQILWGWGPLPSTPAIPVLKQQWLNWSIHSNRSLNYEIMGCIFIHLQYYIVLCSRTYIKVSFSMFWDIPCSITQCIFKLINVDTFKI